MTSPVAINEPVSYNHADNQNPKGWLAQHGLGRLVRITLVEGTRTFNEGTCATITADPTAQTPSRPLELRALVAGDCGARFVEPESRRCVHIEYRAIDSMEQAKGPAESGYRIG